VSTPIVNAPRPHRLALALLLPALFLAARLAGSSCTITPPEPVGGQPVTVIYDKTGGPLAGSPNIRLHRGINGWSPVAAPDPQMTRDPVTGAYSWTFVAPESAYVLDFAFNSVESPALWDNNSTQDWHFAVTAPPAPEEVPGPAPLPSGAGRAGVMMQGFYWDVPAGGTWYDVLASKAPTLRNLRDGQGIDRIWFPPPSKGQSGAFSMGYDPYDYYDLGAYNQKGTVAGRFGTQAQLKSAIAAYHAQGIAVLADIVCNHRAGGALETNPHAGGSTYTNFSGIASGRAAWRHEQFHPSTYEHSDDMAFADYPDVCLAANTPDVRGWPRRDLIDWLVWLRDPANAGFDGWRLDLAQGFRPSFAAELRRATGNSFAVMEKWDRNTRSLEAHVVASGGTPTFDFAAYYTLREICLSPATADVRALLDPTKVCASKNPAKAVTFCENHDTDKEATQYLQNKMLAYAFVLTYAGYPCLFWKDFFDHGLATLGGQSGNGITALVWARGALAAGRPAIEVLKGDARDLLVYGTSGGTRAAPGYIAALSTHPSSSRSAAITTSNPTLRGRTLRCYAWYSYATGANLQPPDADCSANGTATLTVPPLGYAVYGPAALLGEPPAITAQPLAQTVTAGAPTTMSVRATGAALTYQWRLDGVAIAGATSSTYTLPRTQTFHAGSYTVAVSDGSDTVVSSPASLTVQPPSASGGQLLNISTRGLVGRGSEVMIPGFVVSNGGARTFLVRGIGPGLAQFGVPGTLADPIVLVYEKVPGSPPTDQLILSNDDWAGIPGSATTASVTAAVGAFPLPAGSADAAFVVTLPPGAYTVVVRGKDDGTGTAIAEVYLVP
jgi:alpha-amylase